MERNGMMLGSGKKSLNSELWHACAGPLVSLPNSGTRVLYFPQGHSEQVKWILLIFSSKLLLLVSILIFESIIRSPHPQTRRLKAIYHAIPTCLLNSYVTFTMLQCTWVTLTLHLPSISVYSLVVVHWFHRSFNFFQADTDTDEVYAQMTLQPLSRVKHNTPNTQLLFFYFISIQLLRCACYVLILFFYLLCLRRSKKITIFPLKWVYRPSSRWITFVKPSLQAIQVHMADSLFHDVLLRKFSHLWFVLQITIN